MKEECKNKSCEVKACNLRHPKICRFFRDYRRCKFGEWCHFKHLNNTMNSTDLDEIKEKLDNLTKLINEKDTMINDLKEKLKKLEKKYMEMKTP